jgi:hypothetical protein
VKTRPNIAIPKTPWAGSAFSHGGGDDALSIEAQVIQSLAITFPAFEAPGLDMMVEYHRYSQEASGSTSPPFGPKKIQKAIAELKRRGLYSIRRASLGRLPNGQAAMAFARLYLNAESGDLGLLDRLTDDDVRRHDRAVKVDYERWERVEIWPGYGQVIPLDERRATKAG